MARFAKTVKKKNVIMDQNLTNTLNRFNKHDKKMARFVRTFKKMSTWIKFDKNPKGIP